MVAADKRIEILEDELKLLKGEVKRTLVDLRAFVLREDSPLTERMVHPRAPIAPMAQAPPPPQAAPLPGSERRVESLEDELRAIRMEKDTSSSSPGGVTINYGSPDAPAAGLPQAPPGLPAQPASPDAQWLASQMPEEPQAPTLTPAAGPVPDLWNEDGQDGDRQDWDRASRREAQDANSRAGLAEEKLQEFPDDTDPQRHALKSVRRINESEKGTPSRPDSGRRGRDVTTPPREPRGERRPKDNQEPSEANDLEKGRYRHMNGSDRPNQYGDINGSERPSQHREMSRWEYDDTEDDDLMPAGEERHGSSNGSGPMSQDILDVNMVGNLVRWAALARRRMGPDKLRDMLNLYFRSGHNSKELRETIVYICSMEEEDWAANPEQECVDLIHQLHGILTGAMVVPYKPRIQFQEPDHRQHRTNGQRTNGRYHHGA